MRIHTIALATPLVLLTQTAGGRTIEAGTVQEQSAVEADAAAGRRVEVAQLMAILDDERVPHGRRVQAARDLGRAKAPEAIPVLLKHVFLAEDLPTWTGVVMNDPFFDDPMYGVCCRALENYGREMYEPVVRAYMAAGRQPSAERAWKEQFLLRHILGLPTTAKSVAGAARFVMEFGKAVTDPADQRELFRLFCQLDSRWPDHVLPPTWPTLGD